MANKKTLRTKELLAGAFQFRASPDLVKNLTAILRGLRKAADKGVRLLVLQECALTGYAPVERADNVSIDKKDLARAVRTVKQEAEKYRMWVALGSATFASGTWRNSLLLLSPAGKTAKTYHKRALYGRDAEFFAPGATAKSAGLAKIDGVTAGLRICFEFRFPEYFRELLQARARLALAGFCMNGPAPEKFETARAHLISRAAENGLFLIAANSATPEQNCPSAIIAPDGRVLAEAERSREALITARLDLSPLSGVSADIVRLARKITVEK